MTETVKASQEDSKKDSSSQQPSPKPKSKFVKQTSEGNERQKSSEKVEKPPTKVIYTSSKYPAALYCLFISKNTFV